jgi:hypothetical protein
MLHAADGSEVVEPTEQLEEIRGENGLRENEAADYKTSQAVNILA